MTDKIATASGSLRDYLSKANLPYWIRSVRKPVSGNGTVPERWEGFPVEVLVVGMSQPELSQNGVASRPDQ